MSRIHSKVFFSEFEGLFGSGSKRNKKDKQVLSQRKGFLKFAINFLNSILAEYARNISLFSAVLYQFGRKMTFKSKLQKQRF